MSDLDIGMNDWMCPTLTWDETYRPDRGKVLRAEEVEKLDLEWENWTHQLSQELKAEGEDLEAKIREAGGEDLKKAEIATNLAIAKLKSGLQGVVDKLKDSDPET